MWLYINSPHHNIILLAPIWMACCSSDFPPSRLDPELRHVVPGAVPVDQVDAVQADLEVAVGVADQLVAVAAGEIALGVEAEFDDVSKVSKVSKGSVKGVRAL